MDSALGLSAWPQGTAPHGSASVNNPPTAVVNARVGRVHGDMDLNDVLPIIPHQAAGWTAAVVCWPSREPGRGTRLVGYERYGELVQSGTKTPLPFAAKPAKLPADPDALPTGLLTVTLSSRELAPINKRVCPIPSKCRRLVRLTPWKPPRRS